MINRKGQVPWKLIIGVIVIIVVLIGILTYFVLSGKEVSEETKAGLEGVDVPGPLQGKYTIEILSVSKSRNKVVLEVEVKDEDEYVVKSEEFTDLNENGVWDFSDIDEDGICDWNDNDNDGFWDWNEDSNECEKFTDDNDNEVRDAGLTTLSFSVEEDNIAVFPISVSEEEGKYSIEYPFSPGTGEERNIKLKVIDSQGLFSITTQDATFSQATVKIVE